MLKHIKLGFGSTTEFACYDIRNNRITRDEGIALVERFDGLCADRFIEGFCRWIEIDTDEFESRKLIPRPYVGPAVRWFVDSQRTNLGTASSVQFNRR